MADPNSSLCSRRRYHHHCPTSHQCLGNLQEWIAVPTHKPASTVCGTYATHTETHTQMHMHARQPAMS